MINDGNEHSTDSVTTKSKANSTMSLDNGEQKPVQNSNEDAIETPSQENQLAIIDPEEEEEEGTNDDEFIRITAAHQMLKEAQTYDEQKSYPSALHLYRICVDLLLEELMFTEGTDQSRIYLREKCTAIMDRIDSLKNMLEPIPPSSSSSPPPPEKALPSPPQTTTTAEQTTDKPPTEEFNSLHLS